MDLTDDELDYTRLAKGLLNMKGLKEMEKKYKDSPKIINRVYKEMTDIIVRRLIDSGVEYD